MRRYVSPVGLILILGCAVGSANDIVLSVSGFPTTYTPGSTITFDVGLSGESDLNAYNVGLELNSSAGTAGSDFYFAGSPTTVQAPAGSYVFSPSLGVSSPFGFVATADTIPSTNTALLSLSDFLADGQMVYDSSPDTMLAVVAVKTTPAAGNLTLSFDGSVLELLDPSGHELPGAPVTPTAVAATVPEPTSFVLLGLPLLGAAAALGFAGYRSRRRREKCRLSRGGDQTLSGRDELDTEEDAILCLPTRCADVARRAA